MKVGIEPMAVDMTAVSTANVLDHMRAWPDKLIAFLEERIWDDDFKQIVKDYTEFADEDDRYGQAIRKWVNS